MKHALLVLALAPLLLIAGPARAGDEFEEGFRDELGRIAAHEAVYFGRGLLARILLGPPAYPVYVYEYPPLAYGYAPPPYWTWGPPPYRYHRHHHHHHYHRDCD